MNLDFFSWYLLVINLLGFILFTIYMFSGSSSVTESDLFDRILTITSLMFGSFGMIIAIILFGRTPRAYKKETMMSRVFISCIFVIQIILILIIKGYIGEQITFRFLNFFLQHKWIIIYLTVINFVSFAIFALDKFKALERRTRIRIVTLLSLCFFGGTIGGLLAMYLFRHKTKQDFFTVGLPLMLIMQVIVLFYIMNI